MNKIDLETLSLIAFNKANSNHIAFFKRLVTDESIIKRFGGLLSMLNNTTNNNDDNMFQKGYFIADGNEFVGYIDIGRYNESEKAVYLRGAIIKEKRNLGYGIRMLNEASNYIFSRYPTTIKEIKLKTAEDNAKAIKTIKACGYKQIYGTLFSRRNPYYEKKQNHQLIKKYDKII